MRDRLFAAITGREEVLGRPNWPARRDRVDADGCRRGRTEGTANFLVNRRMNKSQQMRWSRHGADLLLQVRCAVYNCTLGFGFGQRFDRLVNADPAFAKAA
jgi:hypothetical protein